MAGERENLAGADIDVMPLPGWMSVFEVRQALGGMSRQGLHHLLWNANTFDVDRNVRAIAVGAGRSVFVVRRTAVRREFERRVKAGILPADAVFPDEAADD